MEWMFRTCSCAGCDAHGGHSEFQVQLSTDLAGARQLPKHVLTKGDSFDITFSPSSVRGIDALSSARSTARGNLFTPRQQDIRDNLELPMLPAYPEPPSCTREDCAEERKLKLLEMYHEFALDMHTGMYITQLTSTRSYSDIHCQLMEDLMTLKLDQGSGHIVEFPLAHVSKLYRILKCGDKWFSTETPMSGALTAMAEQIVVVEFMRRKLAFVFKDPAVSQRFLICMELLIRRAQQKLERTPSRSLAPVAAAPTAAVAATGTRVSM